MARAAPGPGSPRHDHFLNKGSAARDLWFVYHEGDVSNFEREIMNHEAWP